MLATTGEKKRAFNQRQLAQPAVQYVHARCCGRRRLGDGLQIRADSSGGDGLECVRIELGARRTDDMFPSFPCTSDGEEAHAHAF